MLAVSSTVVCLFLALLVQLAQSQQCVDRRLLQQYEAKGCKPVITKGSTCPTRYDCPKENLSKLRRTENACYYGNKMYTLGEKIQNPNPCKSCQCSYGNEISCAYVECPGSAFGIPPFPRNATHEEITTGKFKNCYYYYKHDECCGQSKCPSDEELNAMKTCTYDSKIYRLGQQIFPKENPCKTCICSESWDPQNYLSTPSCKPIQCDLNNKKLAEGCVPIYHPAHCCPIDYKCPPPNYEERQRICHSAPQAGPCLALLERYYFNSTRRTCEPFNFGGCVGNQNNFRSIQECQEFCTSPRTLPSDISVNKCRFGDRFYEIGDKLETDDHCVECSCRLPPDMHCVNIC